MLASTSLTMMAGARKRQREEWWDVGAVQTSTGELAAAKTYLED
jgi:hypothetical protein